MTRLRHEDGYAVPIAIMLMAIMLIFGLGSLAFVDGETRSSRVERTQEARLNLTEGVVAAQIFQLSRGWPSSAVKALPTTCSQTSSAPQCPQGTQVRAQFSAQDMNLNATWDVKVRDDATGQYYNDAAVLAAGNPAWDANGNGEMWVRAEGRLDTVRSTNLKVQVPRVVVARVRVERRPLTPPKAPFVAGSFATGNNGNKVIVLSDTPGVVRCFTESTNDSCIKFSSGQISPVGKVDSDPDRGSALADGMADALRDVAISKGTYYTSCPADPSGEVVWVETGNCSYQGNNTYNGTTKKGVFIVNNGTLTIRGGVQWYGLIYMLNAQNTSGTVAELSGTATIFGGLYIEGTGRLTTGNSGGNGNCANCDPNLVYDPSVSVNITAYGTAGIIQNTWRELLPE